MTGGDGNDTFVFNRDNGWCVVTDFTVGEDVLEIHGLSNDPLSTDYWENYMTSTATGISIDLVPLGSGFISNTFIEVPITNIEEAIANGSIIFA